MKQFVLLFVASCFFFSTKTIAQENLKIGHVNIPEIIQQMPDTDSIKTVIDKETKEMELMYGEMIKEHEANITKFDEEKDSYSEFVREAKEKDLMEMAGKIQQFNQTANQQLQKRNMELLQPVYAKINTAIERIAMENSFTYILDLSNGSVVYHAANSQDLNPLVLEELNIQSH